MSSFSYRIDIIPGLFPRQVRFHLIFVPESTRKRAVDAAKSRAKRLQLNNYRCFETRSHSEHVGSRRRAVTSGIATSYKLSAADANAQRRIEILKIQNQTTVALSSRFMYGVRRKSTVRREMNRESERERERERERIREPRVG